MNGKREYGDYQTPDAFALDVCKFLKGKRKLAPKVIIEPTCGTGSFIKGSLIFDAERIIGIDINSDYCAKCAEQIADPRVEILNADLFALNFSSLVGRERDVLVIGNPPWVTSSTLSSLNSGNIPQKANFKGLKGMDALTGASNFDICEYIILQIVAALCGTNSTIAMLCKTSVARNVFSEIKRSQISFKSFDLFEFNGAKVFGISASACLLVITLTNVHVSPGSCGVYSFENPECQVGTISYKNGVLCNDAIRENCDFSGRSCFEWRQGVKHDCSKIMELSLCDGRLINGLKEVADIEPAFVYPLIKSSMFKSAVISNSDKYVIVTQKTIRENTEHIKSDAPKTWEYLASHKDFFERRKSSIYKNAPNYSMFGVGEYSYSQYKVGVSGFYKKPLFSLLYSETGRPMMTDDTSYFICFPSFNTAYAAMLILNSQKVQTYLSSIAFLDSKRPFTKKVLEQIDFIKALDAVQSAELSDTERRLGLRSRFSEEMLVEFASLPEFGQFRLPLYA